jgi:hypothetical protein
VSAVLKISDVDGRTGKVLPVLAFAILMRGEAPAMLPVLALINIGLWKTGEVAKAEALPPC